MAVRPLTARAAFRNRWCKREFLKGLEKRKNKWLPRIRREDMKKILTVVVLGTSLVLVSACNTVRGAAEDVESVGDCVDGVEGNC